MKLKIKLIIFVTSLSFVVIWFLYFYQKEQINPELDFSRKFYKIEKSKIERYLNPSNKDPDFLHVFNNTSYVYSIADKSFYIQNGNSQKSLYYKYQDSVELILSFIADSNSIIGLDQKKKRAIILNTNDLTIASKDIPIFVKGMPINDSIVILASIDTIINDRVFHLYNLNSKEKKEIKTPFPIIGDFGFAKDGFFKYSNEDKKVVYVLYHLGTVLTFDQNYNTTIFNTIDNYQFNPSVIKKGDRYYISQKSVTVNLSAAIDKNNIYVLSDIRSISDRKNNVKGQVLDIYDAKFPNKYKYSCHFGNEYIKPIIDMYSSQNMLYLMTYDEILKIDLSHLP